MRIKNLASVGALAMAFAVGACGDSTGTNTITMTNAEASEVVLEIFTALGSGGLSISRVASGPMLSRINVASLSAAGALGSITATANCTPSGSVTVSGTSTSAATSTFDVTETFNACTTTHFVLNGSLNFTGSSTEASGTFSIKGTVHITGSKSGDCVIDWTITANATSATSSGTICGMDASGVSAA